MKSSVRRPHRAAGLAGALALAVTLSACGSGAASDDGTTTVRLGAQPFQDRVLYYIAQEKGWYADEGIDLQLSMFPFDADTQLALAGDAVDIGVTCDIPALLQAAQSPNTVYSAMTFSFEGYSISSHEGKFTPYDQFISQGLAPADALKTTAEQLRGKTVVAAAGTNQEAAARALTSAAGMNYDAELNQVDLDPHDGAAYFASGKGDFFAGGVPETKAAISNGGQILITSAQIGAGAVANCGEMTTREYYEQNPEIFEKLQAIYYRTVQYLRDNPDEGYGRVAQLVSENTGAEMSPEAAQEALTELERLPASAAEANELFYSPDSSRYWRDRFEFSQDFLITTGQLQQPVDLDQLVVSQQINDRLLAASPE